MSELEQFLASRDALLTHRTDYEAAVAAFRWPVLTHFNWGLDYFDSIARDNPAPALHIVEASGEQFRLSYAELSQRSNQVANWLVALGARKGDRILLMMGNEVPLWETMLAAIKLGVVLIPATTLLSGDDLQDRLERGRVKCVITNTGGMAKVLDLPGAVTKGLTLVSVSGGAGLPAGWQDYGQSHQASTAFTPPEPTRVTDPLLEYFTSGTTAKPKLVQHTQQSYPVGHLSTLYWLGLQKGDVHWTISSPGQARLELLFCAAQCASLRVHLQLRALQRARHSGHVGAAPGQHLVRTAHGVAHADSRRPESLARAVARVDLCRRAAQPRGHRSGARRLAHHHPRRLWPDRDHGPDWQPARCAAQGGLDGTAFARLPHGAAQRRWRQRRRRRDLH
jgi:hypothetical protein